MKKIILLMVCFVLFLTGCDNESKDVSTVGSAGVDSGENADGQGDSGTDTGSGEENKDSGDDEGGSGLKGIMDEMMGGAEDLPSMLHVDPSTENAEVYFASLSTVDYGIVKDFIYESTTDTSNPAPEMAIIQVGDTGDIEAVEESLRAHLESRRTMFENYAGQIDERQMPMIESAEVFSEGDYVVLIVAENAKDVKEIFYEAVKK